MKKNLFITCALGLLSCAFSVQASDPWNYYRAGSSYSSPSYTQKYDSTFGMSIKGVYGIAGDSDMPNLGGGLLSLNSIDEPNTQLIDKLFKELILFTARAA